MNCFTAVAIRTMRATLTMIGFDSDVAVANITNESAFLSEFVYDI